MHIEMAGSLGSKYYDVFLDYDIWLSYRNEKLVDEYLLKLLLKIEESGSLMNATKEMNVSYRKAWGDLKKAEKSLKIKFTEKIRGGKNGGHSILTNDGRNIVEAYKELKSEYRETMSRITKKFFNKINE